MSPRCAHNCLSKGQGLLASSHVADLPTTHGPLICQHNVSVVMEITRTRLGTTSGRVACGLLYGVSCTESDRLLICIQPGFTLPTPGFQGTMNPGDKYKPYTPVNLTDRQWPSKIQRTAPIWTSVDNGDSDLQALYDAVVKAWDEKTKPTLVCVRTTIGFGSVNQGKASTHGSPLKDDDIAQLKQKFGFNPDEKFVVPDDVRAAYKSYAEQGAAKRA